MTYMYREDREEYDAQAEGLEQLLEEMEPGDCLVVPQFSALAKNTKGFLSMLSQMETRGIRLRSLQENFDTDSEQGKFAASILQKAAQLDEDYRREKQREGIHNAKEEGRYKGRKPIEVDEEAFDAILERWKNGEITARQAMNELDLKPNTFYRRAKERMTDVKNGEAILNAAKQLGKEIIAGVTAETEELSQAAEKFAAEHDVETITNTVTETLGKNITAAGTVINRCIDSLSKNIQDAVAQKKKAEEPAPAADVVDAAEPEEAAEPAPEATEAPAEAEVPVEPEAVEENQG